MSTDIESQRYITVESVQADGEIPINVWKNEITGLRVVIAPVECPIVKGDLTFVTEAFDDDGLPHTLEHLVFMGSENYPFKGVLDLLANRCLADGTNAYTDTDHTNYTVSTAGSDGFLKLLPIYLDHVLFPTLTDSAYMTEVHHINGDGEDAGVVYCEMQARENTGEERCFLEMVRSMYPGKCGYSSQTGGILGNLRESTSNKKVREYHKQFYHSKNLCVIVTGPVEASDVFKAIKPIEDKIVQKGLHKIEFDRPWQTPVEPLDSSVERTIQYSSDTDDDGLVYIGYRGPNVVDDHEEFIAITIVLEYLNSTSVSPIQRDFVESEQPYCSSVSHNLIENSISCMYFAFESVGKSYLSKVANKLHSLMKDIVDETEPFDMGRMQTIISRKIVRILSVAETSPHSIVVGPVISNFLYGKDKLEQRCQEIPILKKFVSHSKGYWLQLIDKYLSGPESRHVCIVGEPSPSMMKQLANAEKQRIDKQKLELQNQLSDISMKLQSAIEFNEKPAPMSMLSSVDVPSPENIRFHPIERVVLAADQVPFRFHYDSIKTNFITINVLLNTSHALAKQDRLYLPLIAEMILESPIERDGELVPYEKIVAELFSDTVATGASIGISATGCNSVGIMGMLFGITMQVEIEKYEKAIKWFHEFLYKTVFTPERIKTVATKIVSDISQFKRSGSKVVGATMNALAYQSNSNQWAVNFMRQQKFLKQLLKNLKSDPDMVKKNLTRVRDTMCPPKNILVHIALDKNKIDVGSIHKPWLKLIPEQVLNSSSKEHMKLDSIIPCSRLFDPVQEPKAAIVGVGSVESNYLQTFVKSIDSPKHPDVAAVYVLINYLTQLEGPLWRQLRGLGLSYGYSINLSPSEGAIYLALSRSTHVVAAYAKAKEIIYGYLTGEDEFEDNLFESAKSIMIFEIIKREKSAAGKSLQSLIAYLRDLDIDFNRELIQRVSRVTKEDLRRVIPLYLKPLFEDPGRRTAVCCHPSRLEGVIKGLSDVGCHVDKINFEEAEFLNSCESRFEQAIDKPQK